MDRLLDSAHYFDIHIERGPVADALVAKAGTFAPIPHRVRLLIAENGGIRIESTPMPGHAFCDEPDPGTAPWAVALADHPVDPAHRFLYHKTTRRDLYDAAQAGSPGTDDVILWNTRNELTESTMANLVVRLDGRWLTPPVSCGLLGGTYRRCLIEHGRVEEAVIPVSRLPEATEIFLVNSVRGWVRTTTAW